MLCNTCVVCFLQEQEECIKETQILSSLDSEYIIKYYDSFLDKVTAAAAVAAAWQRPSSFACRHDITTDSTGRTATRAAACPEVPSICA
jgi:hypothetical protein